MRRYLYTLVAISLVTASSTAGHAAEFKKIKKGQTVGAQTMGPGPSKLVNKGNIQGGSDAGVTATGPGSKTIVNNGSISGSTGIKASGSGSVTIVNTGQIVGGTGVSVGP